MTAAQTNDFLREVAADPRLQRQLRGCDPTGAAALAAELGFDVTVGDLTRYRTRATSWKLSDEELDVVARWQAPTHAYWWQYIWPDGSVG